MSARLAPLRLAFALLAIGAVLCVVGVAVGSEGWEPLAPWSADANAAIVWELRAPRTLGAWLAGALLGLAGAVAQGLFRNPLADPYLLGSATGAALGVAVLLVLAGLAPAAGTVLTTGLGVTGAAFIGATCAVVITLGLARGVQHTLRLVLAGVIVGMVAGAMTALVMFRDAEVMRAMQSFLLGTTSFLGWPGVALQAAFLAIGLAIAVVFGRALDALTLGEATAASLGVALVPVRRAMIVVLSLATAAAVAQVGLVAFVGLIAPHLVRGSARPTHRGLLALSALTGGALLLAADVVSRWAFAPRELPVGVVTAVLGGAYLLWAMHRRPA